MSNNCHCGETKCTGYDPNIFAGWERTGQMLCIVDTSLSVLMALRMCLRELCCLFTVWI